MSSGIGRRKGNSYDALQVALASPIKRASKSSHFTNKNKIEGDAICSR
jgi:hypothetical protein